MNNYFDPVIENPLPDGMDLMIRTIGAKEFLKEAIDHLGISISKPLSDLTEEECMKVCRGIYRNAIDYKGAEMKQ